MAANKKKNTLLSNKHLSFFRFKKNSDGDYLLTNDLGDFVFLPEKDFEKLAGGKIDEKSKLYAELVRKNFIKTDGDYSALIDKYGEKNKHFFQRGTSLHIIVATLRCNYNCLYCQASSRALHEKDKDLDKKTARKIVDTIFTSPNRNLTIEFQGGEPLVNWPVVKFVVEYARKKNKREKRNLGIALVSNFSLMTEEIADFLFKNKVTFCTSLDGPESLHNKNRIWAGGNSHRAAAKWLKYLMGEYKNHYVHQPGALTTITRFSFPFWKEIVDEYVGFGLDNIALRPLTPLGMAKKSWRHIGYSPDEFLEFYKKSLDYVFFLNLEKGKKFKEINAAYLAKKIFSAQDPNFFDLRSPCGAGIGQLLYNYNGEVYTCDEGRMLGEDICKIGEAGASNKELLVHPAVKALCLASCLENLPCDNCVYKPYCGTCPILNYAESGNIFPQLPNSSRCRIYGGILEYLFSKIKKDDRIKALLKKWAAN